MGLRAWFDSTLDYCWSTLTERNVATTNTPTAGSSYPLPAVQPGTSQVLTTSGASQASTAIGTRCVRIACLGDAWVKIGAPTPVADKTTSVLIPAGAVEYFNCLPTDIVAVLQDSAAGICSITPCQETA